MKPALLKQGLQQDQRLQVQPGKNQQEVLAELDLEVRKARGVEEGFDRLRSLHLKHNEATLNHRGFRQRTLVC